MNKKDENNILDYSDYSCLNSEYDFEIVNILYLLNGDIKGFEGSITTKDTKSPMIWDGVGKSMSNDRGFDLIIRKKIKNDE